MPHVVVDQDAEEKRIEKHLAELRERINQRKRAVSEHERVRLARNLWDILADLEKRPQPVTINAVLAEARVERKHISRYALKPSQEGNETRRRGLPQSVEKYEKIAKAAARCAGEKRADAFHLRLFDGTVWTARGADADTDLKIEAVDRLKSFLEKILEAAAAREGFAEALRVIDRAPHQLEPRRQHAAPAIGSEAALSALGHAVWNELTTAPLPLPKTPHIFLGEFALSDPRIFEGRFRWEEHPWCDLDGHDDLNADLAARLNELMATTAPACCHVQDICQVWVVFGSRDRGDPPGARLVFGERRRLWTDTPSIPALVEHELEAVEPLPDFSFCLLWLFGDEREFDYLFSNDDFWGGGTCTHLRERMRINLDLSLLWSGESEAQQAENAAPVGGEPDVIKLLTARLVDAEGEEIDLVEGWSDRWREEPISADALQSLARPLPKFYLPFFEVHGDRGRLPPTDGRMQAARLLGPAMAMALEPADHELIATICNAAARVPVIEAGETSMLAQLQRALLAEGLDDLSLAAVANRAVDDWTRTVHQRDSEDRAEWLRLYSAARGHQDRRSGHASEEGLP